MISICIPSYNFDIRTLVNELYNQIVDNQLEAEIIVIDDASEPSYTKINNEIKELCSHYVELKNNIGRSKIRNLFLEYNNYSHLLFLDCDGFPVRRDFLSIYVNYLEKSIVVGGREYGDRPHNQLQLLHWTYGTKRESKPDVERRQEPYRSFMTNNFMIESTVLEQIKFDESIANYGHEDTLLGIALNQNNIGIIHINNPVMNLDIENNTSFLSKVRISVNSLYSVYLKENQSMLLVKNVRLLDFWKKTRLLAPIIVPVYSMFEKKIEKNLLGEKPNMLLLDFYKLHQLILVSRKRS